jgi:hypothetical protein
MSRANVIKCSGLRTFSNELSVEPGSLKEALNVNVDEKGVITPRRGFNDFSNPTNNTESTATGFVSQIMEYKNAIIRQYSNQLEYEDINGVFQPIDGTFVPALEGFRTKWQEASSNLYFTSDEGIKKISVANRAALTADMVVDAGGLKAGYVSGKIVPTVGGFLPPSSKVAYRVVFGTKDASNNLIEGSPSSRFVVTNFSEPVVTFEKSSITFITASENELSDGDYIIYNTSNSKFAIYFDVTGGATEPQTVDTIGATYVKVVVPSAAVAAFDNGVIAAVTANVLSSNLPNSTITIQGTDTVLITSTEEENLTDIEDPVTSETSVITSATVTDGKTVNGSSANVSITGVVPNDATIEYFYQVFRTGTISTSPGLSLNEIDPGDEMNIVYESGLTSAEISSKEFTFIDNTPESFRAEGAPLYTNAVTGEGILQANEAPPIATDIELFRNYTFYANTKQRHKLDFTIVSIDNFISSSTRFIVGNSDISRYYTFTGAAEVRNVTIDDVPRNVDFINLFSSQDQRQYYVYFGKSGEFTLTSVDAATDIITLTAHIFRDGESMILNNQKVFIINSTTNTFQVSLESGGSALDLDGTETVISYNSSFVPEVTGAVGYRVGTTGLTTAEIADEIEAVLLDNVDFNLSVASNVITFTHTNNGYTTGITNGAGTDITIALPSTDGIGELAGTDEGGDVLLSGLVSVGQSIDETARSLVKIISQDTTSPVNAYYISNSEDLPGNILLEARSLEDKSFFISIDMGLDTYDNATTYAKGDYVLFENNNYIANATTTGNLPTDAAFWKVFLLGDEFTPQLPDAQFIESFTGNGGTTTIQLTGHGYSTGDKIYVAYYQTDPADPDSFSDVYTITVNGADTFTIDQITPSVGTPFSPTFSTIFSPDVESDNETKSNRIYFSKLGQPEAVPSINFTEVGTQDGEIRRILALRDNLFILKDDGIFILSGTSAPDWSVRLLDSTKIIAADSAVVLNNQIYCLTEQGITRISDSGVGVISRGIENLIDDITNKDFEFSPKTFGIAYENDRAYILFMPSKGADSSATQAFRYNIFEQTWTRWEYEATCGYVISRSNKLFLGNGDRNYISRERKNDNRTDHSDRNFSATISAAGVIGTKLQVSSLAGIKPNDVIVQQQDVTIDFINSRLLKKMDFFDSAITLGASGGAVSYPTTTVANFYTPYPHKLENNSIWTVAITTSDNVNTLADYQVSVVDNNNFTIEFDSSVTTISAAIFREYFFRTFGAAAGDNLAEVMDDLNRHLFLLDFYKAFGVLTISNRTYTLNNLRANTELFVGELNSSSSITAIKTYKDPYTVFFEAYIRSVDVTRNQLELHTNRPFVEGSIEVYKGYSRIIEWNPQHFGDPSALKQISYITIMFDQNNFYEAVAKFASDASQATNEVVFKGKGIGYWGDLPWSDPNHYWGGVGNDIPFRNPVPRGKQKCRYLSLTFEHRNAREEFRIVGISAEVRAISGRGYRNLG